MQRSADAYSYVDGDILYTINEKTFNKCLEGHISSLDFEILDTGKNIKLGKCIIIELSTTGKLAERVKEQLLINQLAKVTSKDVIIVSREMRQLLESAFEGGRRYGLSSTHNLELEAKGEGHHKVPEITFEDWYVSRIIDSTGKEDLLMR